MGTGPGHTDNVRWRRAKRQAIRSANGICQWPSCSLPLNPLAPAQTPDATEVDHIIEVSKGGAPYDPANLRALHRHCHIERHQADAGARRTMSTTPRSSAW